MESSHLARKPRAAQWAKTPKDALPGLQSLGLSEEKPGGTPTAYMLHHHSPAPNDCKLQTQQQDEQEIPDLDGRTRLNAAHRLLTVLQVPPAPAPAAS
ncbi:hypothetical protein CNYM01_12755 [Colletotrichum nymphaeae SA-01]|uniref:Uncharacterized protein n=1 Tax=Colletotrichum nymphaeae SA-01 TaxID=1460502 RepID=A0A135RMH2_9PEZI|nr:hypothetical protein CNYM01_12755 [Colletotrichum nymphaeae SA-01]